MLGWDEDIKSRLGGCGTNVFIGKYCSFAYPEKVFLGNNVRIDPYSHIMTQLITGDVVQIMAQTILSGGADHKITLEGSNFIGYGSKIICATEDYTGEHGQVCEFFYENNKIIRGDVVFKKFSGVASNCIIFPSVTLPEGCAIGENSKVQSKDYLTAWSIYYGRPLLFRGTRKQTESKLKEKWLSAQ